MFHREREREKERKRERERDNIYLGFKLNINKNVYCIKHNCKIKRYLELVADAAVLALER